MTHTMRDERTYQALPDREGQRGHHGLSRDEVLFVRVMHHLKQRISNAKNTLLFVGHQPLGGRGDWLLKGNKSLRLFGQDVDVRAEIAEIGALSAHGDRDDLLRWCRQAQGQPQKVAVVHGEPEVALKFSKTIKKELGWEAFVPSYRQKIVV